MATPMTFHIAPITGAYTALCPKCNTRCIYWEEEDLDENGQLMCPCNDTPT